MRKHDWDYIAALRERGMSWPEIVRYLGLDCTADSLRGQFAVWRKGREDGTPPEAEIDPEENTLTTTLTEADVKRITSLEDLIKFFKVDTERWEVRDYRINKWEQHSVKKGVIPLYQVRANLIPKIEKRLEVARSIMDDMLADAAAHAPDYHLFPVPTVLSADDPVLFEVAIMDPHIGMLAWGREVGGVNYDSSIAVQDYARAVEHLLAWAHIYPVERILYLVGNDLLHADNTVSGVKGGNRGGATASGTMQDVDTRLAKAFTAARRAVVAGIDQARSIAPVTVMVVPGNHDTQQMYRLGEVLHAWYRKADDVEVVYGPNKRKFFGYGKNAFMFTHGEEYARKRENLPLIFATECPAELWVGSTHFEIHTGHNHRALAGSYHPTSELTESRSIRTRSLPALTALDAWHHEEGYTHQRAATALVYRKSGGLAGYHEFSL